MEWNTSVEYYSRYIEQCETLYVDKDPTNFITSFLSALWVIENVLLVSMVCLRKYGK